jgi:hypothetical protein
VDFGINGIGEGIKGNIGKTEIREGLSGSIVGGNGYWM